jgi:Uma2 family endonuclease
MGRFVLLDLSWVSRERWESLTPKQKKGFIPLCPDFVVELRSESDSLDKLQKKLLEYKENGARLGWLIDPRIAKLKFIVKERKWKF